MTGKGESEVSEEDRSKFEIQSARLINSGFEVVNVGASDLREDIVALVKCDGVALFRDWVTSSAARLVVNIAAELSLPVYTIGEWLVLSARMSEPLARPSNEESPQ